MTLEIEGEIGEIAVAGGIAATGDGSDAVHASDTTALLDAVQIRADAGERIVTPS